MSVTRQYIIEETVTQIGIVELYYALKARGCHKPRHELREFFYRVLVHVPPVVREAFDKEEGL